jgi:hypothetical protein
MLLQATKDKLKALGIDPDKLIEAVKAEAETDVEMPEGEFFTPEQITARDEVKLTEGKKLGEREGEVKGKELAAKEMKKAFGVEIEGKDLGKLVEAVKVQLFKGDDGLKEQVKLLQQKTEEYEGKISQIQQEAEAAKFDASLLSELPANRSNLLSDSEYLTVLKANLQFEGDTVKKGGEVLRDGKTANPIARKSAIEQFFQERKWTAAEEKQINGRGGTSTATPTGRPTKTSEAAKEWVAQGKGVGTAEFQSYVTGLAKENKEFVFDTVE